MGVYRQAIPIREGILMDCCLAKGELIRVDGGKAGLGLRCSGGALWLTCGDGADYLLTAGCSHELSARRIAIIEALVITEFCLGEPAASEEKEHRPLMGFSAC